MIISQEIYKEKPVLVFKDEKRIFLSFGKKKAKLIVENIGKIKEFLESEEEVFR